MPAIKQHPKTFTRIVMQKTFITKCPCCEERILSISKHASIHEAGGYILIDLTVSDLKNLERQIAFEVALAGKATNQDHQNI